MNLDAIKFAFKAPYADCHESALGLFLAEEKDLDREQAALAIECLFLRLEQFCNETKIDPSSFLTKLRFVIGDMLWECSFVCGEYKENPFSIYFISFFSKILNQKDWKSVQADSLAISCPLSVYRSIDDATWKKLFGLGYERNDLINTVFYQML